MLILAAIAFALWLVVLALPWHPWRCTERIEAEGVDDAHVRGITVLIPARNEAAVIGETLAALAAAAPDLPTILIDDQSDDATAVIARNGGMRNLVVLPGTTPPTGWTGKLWALEQGLAQVETARVLLLDADIRLAPGMLSALQRKADAGCVLVSACAEPCWQDAAARWLMPAFVYFFKLLYPFALVNRGDSKIAAAAGGVILIDRKALVDAGGFSAWRDAIIDDCTLARHVKRAGHGCFIGLTRAATSLRRSNFRDITHMIARTAFVQLHESWGLLLVATLALVLAFWIPVLAVVFGAGATRILGALAWLALVACYLPVLAYYHRNLLVAIALPFAATAFLAMTWYSGLRTLAGTRSVWKGRRYRREVS